MTVDDDAGAIDVNLFDVSWDITEWTALGYALVDITLRILAIIYIPRNRRPQTAAAWLLAIMFIPPLGWLFFFLFGSRRVSRTRRERQEQINAFIAEMTDGMDDAPVEGSWPEFLPQILRMNRNLGAMPMVGGNAFEFYPDYEASLEAMTRAVREARELIHAEFYILSLDATTRPFFEALADARRGGVTVRVLLDHVANLRQPGFRATKRFFDEHDIQWLLMLPLQPLKGKWQRPDLRNHRKLLVVDGTVGFTGSQNIIDSSYDKRGNIKRGLHWKDLMVRCEGPIVLGIDSLFLSDWYMETGEVLTDDIIVPEEVESPDAGDAQIVPSGPGFSRENNLRLFNALVYGARERLYITSPYFVPDDSMLYAITNAAASGLDVQLFVSEIGDQAMVFHAQRSYYEYLLGAGVKIWLYESPTILHSKHLTVDDEVAVVGSSNMDMRSFSLNYEISMLVRSHDFVRRLRGIEDTYRANSRLLTLDEWMARPARSKVLDNVARLTAGLQ